MLNITKNANNVITLNLKENTTLSNPYYIFEFIDLYKRKVTFSLVNSSNTSAYQKFTYFDGSTNQLYASGTVNIYESIVDASVVDASMNLIRNELYKYILPEVQQISVDISILSTDYVYDPSNNSVNQDFVFTPIWLTGEIPAQGIPASQILQDSTHRFVSDACIANINIINVGVGETSTRLDTLLGKVNFIDSSVGIAHISVSEVSTRLSSVGGAGVGEVSTRLNTLLLKTNAIDTSVGLVVSKINSIDTSLGVAFVRVGEVSTRLSALYTNVYLDASLAKPFISIGEVSTRLSVAGGGVSQAYVDGSLNKRYDTIITGLVIDGGSSAITTGSKGYRKIAQDCKVLSWDIIGSPSGSISIDVKKCDDASFPTTSSIAGTQKPTLVSQTKNSNSNLTTWNTDLSTGDILQYIVDSADTVTKVWLTLFLKKL